MSEDTPPPNPCRSRSPYLDRLNSLTHAIAAMLRGDGAYLGVIASEVEKAGWGKSAENLDKLRSLLKG